MSNIQLVETCVKIAYGDEYNKLPMASNATKYKRHLYHIDYDGALNKQLSWWKMLESRPIWYLGSIYELRFT